LDNENYFIILAKASVNDEFIEAFYMAFIGSPPERAPQNKNPKGYSSDGALNMNLCSSIMT
jgi:hypothetical protein